MHILQQDTNINILISTKDNIMINFDRNKRWKGYTSSNNSITEQLKSHLPNGNQYKKIAIEILIAKEYLKQRKSLKLIKDTTICTCLREVDLLLRLQMMRNKMTRHLIWQDLPGRMHRPKRFEKQKGNSCGSRLKGNEN